MNNIPQNTALQMQAEQAGWKVVVGPLWGCSGVRYAELRDPRGNDKLGTRDYYENIVSSPIGMILDLRQLSDAGFVDYVWQLSCQQVLPRYFGQIEAGNDE
jgi:hypothetical protein